MTYNQVYCDIIFSTSRHNNVCINHSGCYVLIKSLKYGKKGLLVIITEVPTFLTCIQWLNCGEIMEVRSDVSM